MSEKIPKLPRDFRSSVYHHTVTVTSQHGGGKDIFQQEEEVETGWWWMPQKASRYPPIHDQIDTPTDFSVTV